MRARTVRKVDMRDERADEPSEKVDARAATFDIKKRRLEWRADGSEFSRDEECIGFAEKFSTEKFAVCPEQNLPCVRDKFLPLSGSLALLLRTILHIACSFEWFNENGRPKVIRLSG